jgi:hypothetical protein
MLETLGIELAEFPVSVRRSSNYLSLGVSLVIKLYRLNNGVFEFKPEFALLSKVLIPNVFA